MTLESKYERLCDLIRNKKRVLVAFSGGVDSSLLAAVSHKALGSNAVAVTINSPLLPASELNHAKRIAGEIGIKHLIVEGVELENRDFSRNPPDRCYHCKRESIHILRGIAGENHAEILFGTNADDLRDYRPGNKALAEESISTPLAEAGLGKEEVRKLAGKLRLSNADKPSMACLSSRIPYGEEITFDKLRRIEAAEDYIRELGMDPVRVRCYGKLARVEVSPGDFPLMMDNRGRIVERLKELGFVYVSLDLEGFRSGSMDEVL